MDEIPRWKVNAYSYNLVADKDGDLVRYYEVQQLQQRIKELEKEKSFLISCIKSGEQLEDDWEKTLKDK